MITVMQKTPKIAVIIPFYQKEKGLLRRAVESVFAQTGVSDVHVIVADDGCPIHARDELNGIDVPEGFSLKVVRQANRGAGAARNFALDNVEPEINYIAFLDSDDYYLQNHLYRAIEALELGYDFYLAPGRFENKERGDCYWTSYNDFINSINKNRIQAGKALYGTEEFQIELYAKKSGIILTPSVVIRNEARGGLRFREDLPNGQDVFFYFSFLRKNRRVAISEMNEVIIGEGINIWASSERNKKQRLVVALNERLML